MIGYHYTSYDNWKKIEAKGSITPYPLYNLKDSKIGLVDGVWLWQERPTGKNVVGCVLYQLSQKSTTKIVLLECNFKASDIYSFKGQKVETLHHGEIGKFVYHKHFPAWILEKPVTDFKLLKVYDLLKLIQ